MVNPSPDLKNRPKCQRANAPTRQRANTHPYKIATILLLLLLGLSITTSGLQAQQVPVQVQQQVRSELQRRGLDEQEVRRRLLERGINIEETTPEQLPQLQAAIEEVIREMEEEKQQATQPLPGVELPRDTIPQSIRRAVEAGATPEEAMAEREIAEKTKVQKKSKIYGQQLFRDKSLEVYRSVENVKPPESYVLGPGDVVNISIFGVSQADLQFEIAQDGFIRPTNMPRVYLKGLAYGQARELLQQRFRQAYIFRPEQFAVSLNAARTVTVNIFGEVETQGSFTLSAINTAFNALVAAGGPTDIGSVRNIRLIRGGEERYLDVYEFMSDPATQFEYTLENNDIIFVPTAKRVVEVSGAIKRPFRYELTTDENLIELLEFAGGLEADAYTDLIQVTRFQNDEKALIDVPLREITGVDGNFLLENGDSIFIKTIPSIFRNKVEISGAVELPGEYALTPGLRISDLIRKGLLQEEAKTDLAFLFRRNLDETLESVPLDLNAILTAPGSGIDLELKKDDQLLIFTQARYADRFDVIITGAVRMPDTFEYEPNLRASDLVYLAGGLTEEATDFAYIIRPTLGNPDELTYVRVNIREAVEDPAGAANISLQPLDRLQILSKASYTDQSTVRVSGAVRAPGEFRYSNTLTLRDALTLAGGLKLEAASNRIDVFRLQIRDNEPTRTLMYTLEVERDIIYQEDTLDQFQLAPFDQVVVRSAPEFEFQKSIRLEGEVVYPGTYALIDDNERISSSIQRAGGLTPEAYPEGAVLYREENQVGVVIIDLVQALDNPGRRQDLVLKDGDMLSIPKPKELVTINIRGTEAAEVYADTLLNDGKINVAYAGRKSAKWYIQEFANGFSNKARRNSTSVEYASGKISGSEGFLFFPNYPMVEPGSTISVAVKPEKVKNEKEREPVDWGNVAKDILATVTTALTVVLLVQQVN